MGILLAELLGVCLGLIGVYILIIVMIPYD